MECNADVEHARDRLASARQVLLALPLGNESESTQVTEAAKQAIAEMKQNLADFVDAYLQCSDSRISAVQVTRDLSSLGHAFEFLPNHVYSNEEFPKDGLNYGFQLGFKARREPHSNLVSVEATFQIQCGSDSVLMLFESADAGWREMLRWQSPPYDLVSGALGSFGYAVSPPDARGEWYVLVKSIPPWCSSTWSSIRYAVLRPSSNIHAPSVVYQGKEGIWWGNEDFGRLRANATDFEIRFHNHSIDVGVHSRLWINHFVIQGDRVRRTQPVAISPRDFVDDWVQEPWTVVGQWTDAEKRAPLQLTHDRLMKIGFFEYESIRRCSDQPNHYQIGVEDQNDTDHYYFSVTGKSRFTMHDVSSSPNEQCDGANVLDKH
jgi:hypothetical protein